MTLPRFHSRIANAVGAITSAGGIMSRLGNCRITLEAGEGVEDQPEHSIGFLLATNLCARLYPKLCICAPSGLADKAVGLAVKINPQCDVDVTRGDGERLFWGQASPSEGTVVVSAAGWNVLIDQPNNRVAPANPLTTLAAAAFGAGELFRSVFRQFIPAGRISPRPATLNLVTLESATNESFPEFPTTFDTGTVHLVGAGAIGQAMLHAFAQIPMTGKLVIVDPEAISLSNLQRYVLAMDDDVGRSKCGVGQRTFIGSKLQVECVEAIWGERPLNCTEVETVAVALDTAAARIGVQAGLPRAIFNAWTQPLDLGWSRHERFGRDACLACLYTPSGLRASLHELIARALHQHELRILAYLTHRLPVDVVLAAEQIPRLPTHPLPSSASTWLERPLLDDIINDLNAGSTEATAWKGKLVSDLYREGICGGAIVSDRIGELPQEVVVPLSHQSALAGIMLAAQLLFARIPEFTSLRSPFVEARVDVLSGLPQMIGRPRQKTPGCLCSDTDYVARYNEKWTR